MKRTDFYRPRGSQTHQNPVMAQLKALGAVVVIALVADYVLLPAYNIHSMETLFLFGVSFGVYAFLSFSFSGRLVRSGMLAIGAIGALVILTLLASFLGSEWLNAEKYRDQIAITSKTFSSDFNDVDFDKIPLID